MKIFEMKFVDTLLLGIAKNNFHAVLAYFFIQKSWKICLKKSLPGPTLWLFVSMTEGKFDSLP